MSQFEDLIEQDLIHLVRVQGDRLVWSGEVTRRIIEHFAQIAESWTPDQWEIHPREDFARKEIAAAIRRA